MVKLVDTQCSERCGSDLVGVQIPLRAPNYPGLLKTGVFYWF